MNDLHNQILQYQKFDDSLTARKLTKNQLLYEKCLAVDRIFRSSLVRYYNEIKAVKSGSYQTWDVRFHHWVLAYLSRGTCERLFILREQSTDKPFFNRELTYFNSERARLERELVIKPKIFRSSTKKGLRRQSHPVISVITPSYNHGHFLEDTIRSITAQSFSNFEHIVIDGVSTDQTVKILKKYPHIRWVSKKDSGYNEAFGKGLAMTRGKYIMNCAVSDAYADKNWFKRCVSVLDSNPDVSLVWGFPQNLSEEGVPGKVSYAHFHLAPVPQKQDFFYFWLRSCHGYPEGNICVRKEVMEKCILGFSRLPTECDIWKEFLINFNENGYLSYNIPVVANFGRTHKNQSGQRDREAGVSQKLQKDYVARIRNYRWGLLLGTKKHNFRDGAGRVLDIKFFTRRYVFEHFQNLIERVLFQKNRFLFRNK